MWELSITYTYIFFKKKKTNSILTSNKAAVGWLLYSFRQLHFSSLLGMRRMPMHQSTSYNSADPKGLLQETFFRTNKLPTDALHLSKLIVVNCEYYYDESSAPPLWIYNINLNYDSWITNFLARNDTLCSRTMLLLVASFRNALMKYVERSKFTEEGVEGELGRWLSGDQLKLGDFQVEY